MKTKISILILIYDLMFRDSDDGSCYAGDGSKIISVHRNQADAESIAKEYNPIIQAAEKEIIVFPIQSGNWCLKERFGFTLHNLDDDAKDFKLIVKTYEVEE